MLSAVLLAAAGGCHRGGDQPSAAVDRFFAAIKRRDCEGMKALVAGDLAGVLAREGCSALFDDFERHGVRFGGRTGTRDDGRDPRARLVDARVTIGGHERTRVVRVERDRGSWRMARF